MVNFSIATEPYGGNWTTMLIDIITDKTGTVGKPDQITISRDGTVVAEIVLGVSKTEKDWMLDVARARRLERLPELVLDFVRSMTAKYVFQQEPFIRGFVNALWSKNATAKRTPSPEPDKEKDLGNWSIYQQGFSQGEALIGVAMQAMQMRDAKE